MWSARSYFADSYVVGATSKADRARFQAWLDAMKADIEKPKRPGLPWPRPRGPLDLDEARRTGAVAEAVIDAGGPGVTEAVRYLLLFVASCPDASLVTFWERVMPARHAFGKRDKTASLRAEIGGWALFAIADRGSSESIAAMLRVLPAVGAADRGTLLLRGALPGSALRNSDEWIAATRRVAAEDADFQARYLARSALRILGEPLPREDAEAYVFTLRYRDFSCAIEVAAESSLDALEHAIHEALRWDDDHLWCFYLDGRRGDGRFTWPDEEWAFRWYEASAIRENAASLDFDLPRLERVRELGLRAGNQILYHFDFGANHLVPLKVRRVGDAHARRLPAITAAKGKRPRQYDG